MTVVYKILDLTFKYLYCSSSPGYLKQVLSFFQPGGTLRSTMDQSRLVEPGFNKSSGG